MSLHTVTISSVRQLWRRHHMQLRFCVLRVQKGSSGHGEGFQQLPEHVVKGSQSSVDTG